MKKPRMQTVVSVVEIMASLAVVLSLWYAAYEFRRSETLNSRDVENILYQRMLEMDRLIIENPDVAGLLRQASDDPNGLSPADSIRFVAYEHIFYDSWESAWYYYHEGILEERAWDSWNGWFAEDAQRRPLLGWLGNRENTCCDFLAYVDGILHVDPAIAHPADE